MWEDEEEGGNDEQRTTCGHGTGRGDRHRHDTGDLLELAADDLQAKLRDDAEADVVVEEDVAGAGDDSDPNTTTRGGKGTGGKTTGGQRGDTTQNVTTHGGQGTGGKTTGGQRGDTTQPVAGTDDGGGGGFFGGGGGSGSGSGT